MAYYLNNPSSGAANVHVPEFTLSAIGDYIEYQGFANSGNPGDSYRILGEQPRFANLVDLNTSNFSVRFEVSFQNLPYTQPAVGVLFTARIEKTGVDEWSYYLDGSLIGTVTTPNSLILSQFMAYSTTTSEAFRGSLYYVERGDSGGAINRWDASASGGTGSILPDTVGTADGTLESFPTDDSQWVFYSAGGAVTGTGDSVSGPSTSSGSGTGVTIGSGASVSQSSSSSGTGTGVTTGTGTSVSGPSTSAGTGLRVITGSGDSVSGPSTSSGTGGPGSAVVTGSGDSKSGPATSSGTGSGVTVGSGASVSGPATSTGVALRVITGSGSSQSGPATSSGSGGSVRVVTGSGNSVSGPSTSTGIGLRVITGSGSSVSGPATSEGSDRGALARPVINPGTVDISPLYASAEIETEYGSIDIAPKYGTTDY